MKKNILVTGSSGFLGKALIKKLDNLGFQCISLSKKDGNISNKNYFDNIRGQKIDHVIHLASLTSIKSSWLKPELFYKVNFIGTLNTLEFCRDQNIPITYVSSYIYGNQEILPIKENFTLNYSNHYALSKKFSEELCFFFNKVHNLNCTILRPFNIFGPGQNQNFLIPELIAKIKKNKHIVVENRGYLRDYVFVDDVINLIIKTIKKNRKKIRVYNIGTGKGTSIQELIHLISKSLNKTVKVKYLNQRNKNEIHDCIADITKLKRDFKFKPLDIENAIQKTIFNQ